ncbi:DUF456 family protein [Streptomyces sp. GC420]|uniref:DUF456 family protein n=1 Tax=Streptomyces sp. GC420 TaxID=2697568 RepID=UPI001414D148|nr:DUF456 family protein [Streptomyces sp. GC420]NBM20375.1 DUF456 family protein [Streptomyces sp. GC420]
MSGWPLLLVTLVMLTGLAGVFVPGVPAPATVWAAVLWWALEEASEPGWWFLAGASGLLLLNLELKRKIPALRAGEPGAHRPTPLGMRVEFCLCLVVVSGWAGVAAWT